MTDSGLIDRREYLKYAGAFTGAPLIANHGIQTATANSNSGKSTEGTVTPTNLHVEYEQEPNNIVSSEGESADGSLSAPRFTWEVTGPRGVAQSAYRILVAESGNAIESGDGDVWDSGEVESSRSINVPYGGDPLEPDTTYYWSVRVQDANGNESGWSSVSQFTTAILNTEDHWEGEWIGGTSSNATDTRPGSEWTDYTLDIEFTLVETAAGFLFRAADEDNLYMWQINESQLQPHVKQDGNWDVLDKINIDNVFEGEGASQRITITASNNEITTSINGEEVDSRTDDTFSSGTIGFRQPWNEQVRIESVQVTDLDDESLFEDEFDQILVENFDGGAIRDEALELRGNHIVLLGEPHNRPAPLLRKEFDLDRELESARLHICGLGYYELHLNGERIGDRVLDPGTTDYEYTVLYSSYDITNELREGSNALGIMLGRGRFGELVENEWDWDDVRWWSNPHALR